MTEHIAAIDLGGHHWGRIAGSAEETAARLAFLEMAFADLNRYVKRVLGDDDEHRIDCG